MNKPENISAMISSTALDLPKHRGEAVNACLSEDVRPIGMEHLPTQDENGICVSLEMVDKADVYIGIYAWRYGWVPDFENPGSISITEMEFNRALERKERGELKEILIFLMHDDHPIVASDKENGEEAQRKLKDFKQRASTGRVVSEFKSEEKLKTQIIQALAEFKRSNESTAAAPTPVQTSTKETTIPSPPAFYAEPDYIGSHQFVGRASQLQDLDDWAQPADTTSLLLFEAIGGNGKSMLTWEWTTKYANQIRMDWAGCFWYSFYERGAVMADFCQRAIAYMTGQPLEELRKKKTVELKEQLLAQLHAKPWLFILDGLERVLVHYHHIDAAELPDEEANAPSDKIAHRDPCNAIRDEDDDLLRALAAAKPSKILISSRLTPRVLLNPSGQAINGAKRITLPGLRPPDAEKLLRACGVNGDSAAIQHYLTANCDNHPLVIGVLGGLINDYLPDRGNFDAWAEDEDGGAKLDLASLDLIQRRNHILRAALDALPQESAQLLSTLALLSDSVDYETLSAFDPHQPPQPKKLADTVRVLERRGLLQYDHNSKRHDLHPVVRGVAAGALEAEEKETCGQRVVDHFSAQSHDPYEQAETLDDLHSGLSVVRTLLKLGHFQQAADAYRGDLANALFFNLEAYAEILLLLRPFFPDGWDQIPEGLGESTSKYLMNVAACALNGCGEQKEALTTFGAVLQADLEAEDWLSTATRLRNISTNLSAQNLIAKDYQMTTFTLDITSLRENNEGVFMSRLWLFFAQSSMGQWVNAEASWKLLDPMGRAWSRATYRPGTAEKYLAQFHLYQGSLQEGHLAAAEHLAAKGNNRVIIRQLHGLRGAWRLEQGEWELAVQSLQEAVRMTRERGIPDEKSETGLALAKFHLGQLTEPRDEAERLSQLRQPAHRLLAQLWLALGDKIQAQQHALAAYKRAWADGEPYVNRYELTKSSELLDQLNVPIPQLPPYDPAKDEKFPWEDDLTAAIEKLRAEKNIEDK